MKPRNFPARVAARRFKALGALLASPRAMSPEYAPEVADEIRALELAVARSGDRDTRTKKDRRARAALARRHA